ncbi:MAG TPA: FkbM family methyltransferase [Longimicrobiales bacterium]|nr:FkbM family methyltransferase [Longimicrobiales bacterium]
MRLPIIAGPLRGRWWLPQSRGKILRILGGSYEPEQTQLFQQQIPAGATVFDVGAHVGYYTLLSAVLTGPRGRVFAFEPNPVNHTFLQRHVTLNRLANVTVENAAVSDRNGTAAFAFGTGSGTGRLDAGGKLEVRTLRLDDFCRAQDVRPGFIKIDVEGAELHVLRGAAENIEAHHPVIFLSTHGPQVHSECLAWLRERNYALHPIAGADLQTASEVLCT